MTAGEWRMLLDALPEGCVAVVDEAYADFVEPSERLRRERDVEAGRAVVVLRTFSKLFGLAGLRLGFAIAAPAIAEEIRAALGPWPVSGPALAIGTRALADSAWLNAARELLDRDAAWLDKALTRAGF